jgi:hypothetical protein
LAFQQKKRKDGFRAFEVNISNSDRGSTVVIVKLADQTEDQQKKIQAFEQQLAKEKAIRGGRGRAAAHSDVVEKSRVVPCHELRDLVLSHVNNEVF